MKRLIPYVLGCVLLVAGPPTPANLAMQQSQAMHMQLAMMGQQRARARTLRQAALNGNTGQGDAANARLTQPGGQVWTNRYNPFKLIAADRDLVVVVHGKWGLAGIARADGQERWEITVPTDSWITDGPVLTEDLVLIALGDYRLLAYSRKDGAERFRVDLGKLGGFLSTRLDRDPVHIGFPEKGQVTVATYGKGAGGDPAGMLISLDLKTGAKRWEEPLVSGAEHPGILLGDQVIAGGGPWLQAFTPEGQNLWRVKFESRDFRMGTESKGRYFFVDGDDLRAIDMKDGHQLWTAKGKAGPVVEGDRVLVGVTKTFGYKLVALDAATGTPLWEESNGTHEPVWVHGGLAFITKGDTLRGLNVSDGKEAWKVKLPVRADRSAILVGEDLVAWYPQGKQTILVALDPATGKTRWSHTIAFKPGDGMFWADGDGILFPGLDGNLVCLK